MKKVFGLLVILCFVTQIVVAQEAADTQAKDAQLKQFEAKIESLIVKNDSAAALKEYATAAKANPQEVYYRQQYSILQRVVKMQDLLKTETNPEKWKSYAKAVRAYFYSKGCYAQAMPVDVEAAGKFKTSDYAANAIETCLLTGNNADAAKYAAGEVAEKSVRFQTLGLVAAAVNGNAEKAAEGLQAVKIDPKTDYKSYFDAARIYSAANNKEKTLSSIKALLENTPPCEVGSAREMIAKSSSFASMQASDDFKAAVATATKVVESGCTGGSNCNSCSQKNKCSKH